MKIENNNNPDLWEYLAETHRPVVLYGTGDGADKILDVCTERGIRVLGVFASDGFFTKKDGRRRCFRGMEVLSYGEVRERFDSENFVVLLCFATRLPEVIGTICAIARERELYVPDIPVAGGGSLFTSAFTEENDEVINRARELFSDEESVALYDGIIEGKLRGSLTALLSAQTGEGGIVQLADISRYKTCIDAGAYSGDTMEEALRIFPGLTRIIGLEPDPRTYKRLLTCCSRLSKQYPNCSVEALNIAAWDRSESLPFGSRGNRGSGTDAAHEASAAYVPAHSIDSVLCSAGADYIKYDVEGAEQRALLGSAETIKRFRPDLCVSVYHRSEDLFKLPVLVSELCPDYSLFLRRTPCLPAWEINLFAVARS